MNQDNVDEETETLLTANVKMRKCLIYRNTHARIPQILNSFAVLKDIQIKRSRLRDTLNLGNASLKNSDNFLHPDL